MFQGGFVDYILVYSTLFMIKWTDKQAKIGNIKSRRKYMCAGFTAAMMHLLSIQPLFFGMATAYTPLMFVTTIFILPTFVLYTYWASSGINKVCFTFYIFIYVFTIIFMSLNKFCLVFNV